MVGILGDCDILGVDEWNCGGDCGVVGLSRSSNGDVLEAADFFDDDSSRVRLFFVMGGFEAADEPPTELANGTRTPLPSISITMPGAMACV